MIGISRFLFMKKPLEWALCSATYTPGHIPAEIDQVPPPRSLGGSAGDHAPAAHARIRVERATLRPMKHRIDHTPDELNDDFIVIECPDLFSLHNLFNFLQN